MKATDVLFQKVMAVLNSNMTSYRIMKEIGDKSQTHIEWLRDGTSSIEDIRFKKLMRFEKLYDSEIGGAEE